MRRTLAAAAVLALALPLLAACGDDAGDTGAAASSTASAAATCDAFEGVPAVSAPVGVAPNIGKPKGDPPKELKVEDCVVGDGEKVTDTSKTYFWNYEGVSWSGNKFDSSFDRGEPIPFALNQVIPGWTEGLQGMKVGGRRLLVIPADQAYGANPPPGSGIEPNEALVFVVDLVGDAPTTPAG